MAQPVWLRHVDGVRVVAGEISSGDFRIVATRIGDDAAITVEGELDLGSAPYLDDKLRVLGREGMRSITLGLAGLSFIDATGLASIIRGRNRCDASGARFVIRAPSAVAMRVFAICGLCEVLTIVY